MKTNRNKTILHFSSVFTLLLCFLYPAAAQQTGTQDEKTAKDKYAYTREGNELYKNKQYAEAESLYVKGSKHETDAFTTAFNLGDAMYKQGKYEQARQQFEMLTQSPVSSDSMTLVHHNIGNCHLQQKQYQQAIDAYKKTLRLNPADEEARYNLAYAQKMLKKEQEKQKKQNPDKQEKDKQKQPEKEQDKKKQEEDQKKKDELEKKKKELQKEQQEKNQQKEQNKQKQRNPATPEPERQRLEQENQKIDQRRQQIQQELEKIERQLREMQGKPEPKSQSEIQKEEARRILEALKNEEKKTREKLDKKSKNNSYSETDKDW